MKEIEMAGDRGMPGAKGDIGGCGREIQEAAYKFGVSKEAVLMGSNDKPPELDWCHVYVCIKDGGIIYFTRRCRNFGEWVNWSYQWQ